MRRFFRSPPAHQRLLCALPEQHQPACGVAARVFCCLLLGVWCLLGAAWRAGVGLRRCRSGCVLRREALRSGGYQAFACAACRALRGVSAGAKEAPCAPSLRRIAQPSHDFLKKPGRFVRGAQKPPTIRSLAAVAQLDRVLGYEPRGRGFDSCQPHQLRASRFRSRGFLYRVKYCFGVCSGCVPGRNLREIGSFRKQPKNDATI